MNNFVLPSRFISMLLQSEQRQQMVPLFLAGETEVRDKQ
jgi:hypothetical protein